MYLQIASNKNKSYYCNKRMFGFQFDQLNWAYYLQETLNPEVKVLRTFLLYLFTILYMWQSYVNWRFWVL